MADKKKYRSAGLVKAIEAADGVSKLTYRINEIAPTKRRLTVQAVSQWIDVPPDRCLEVEQAIGVSRYDLRPDIYGPAPRHKRTETRPAA